MKQNSTPKRIAMIGAGFSGTMVAVHLLRNAKNLSEIFLIDRSGSFGRGVAYSTDDESHLLNVPAFNMSAFASKPNHFTEWLRETNTITHLHRDQVDSSFVPRRLYGKYLQSVIEEAKQLTTSRCRLTEYFDEAVGLEQSSEKIQIQLKSGRWLEVEKVVLALGNFPSGLGTGFRLPRGNATRALNPWDPEFFTTVRPEDRLLILGSGLTMIDTVVSLKERGHRGSIFVLSRHGLLPQIFEPVSPYESPLLRDNQSTLSSYLRRLRIEVERAKALSVNWHSVFYSLRAKTPELWRSLSPRERNQFLRHLRTYWDTHRHQMAPEVGVKIKRWLSAKEMELIAGRIRSMEKRDQLIEVRLKRRGFEAEEKLSVHQVVSCVGLEGDFNRLQHPLVECLRNQSLIRPDPLGLGIETTSSGHVVNAKGVPSDGLFAIGSLRRGELWESVAVPELRVQAEELAHKLLLTH